MLTAVGTRLLDLIAQIGYQGIAFAMFLENVFPPIPSELIMPFAGFLAGQGKMHIVGVIAAGVIGTYLGVLPFYCVGRILHKKKLFAWTQRRGAYIGIEVGDLEKTFAVFEKRGYPFVFFGRFIPLFRTLISFPAGAMHMHFGRYSLYTLLGSAVWCSLLAGVGYVLGDQWTRVGFVMKQYEHGILALLVIGFLFLVNKRLWKK